MENLPLEMIYEIPRHLGSFQELASLVRVSRRFYDILNPVLYKLDCKTGSPTALFWAAMIGNLRTLELSHAAGANLEQAWTSRRPLLKNADSDLRTANKLDKTRSARLKQIWRKLCQHKPETYTQLFEPEHTKAWKSIMKRFGPLRLRDIDGDGEAGYDGESSWDDYETYADYNHWHDYEKYVEYEPEDYSDHHEPKTASRDSSYTFLDNIREPTF